MSFNFKKFCEEKFGIAFSKKIVFEERKEGVRAFTKPLMSIDIKGKRGILVYVSGPTNAFARTFGHLAKNNKIFVSESEAKDILQNKKIRNEKKLSKNEYFLVFFKNHPIAVVFCNGEFLVPAKNKKKFLPINDLKQ